MQDNLLSPVKEGLDDLALVVDVGLAILTGGPSRIQYSCLLSYAKFVRCSCRSPTVIYFRLLARNSCLVFQHPFGRLNCMSSTRKHQDAYHFVDSNVSLTIILLVGIFEYTRQINKRLIRLDFIKKLFILLRPSRIYIGYVCCFSATPGNRH